MCVCDTRVKVYGDRKQLHHNYIQSIKISFVTAFRFTCCRSTMATTTHELKEATFQETYCIPSHPLCMHDFFKVVMCFIEFHNRGE